MSETDEVQTQNQDTQPQNTEQPVNNQPVSSAQVSQPDEPYDLDLDLLEPQSKKVRLKGVVYDVYPPKLKDIVALSRIAGQMNTADPNEVQTRVEQMIKAFESIMPGLKDVDVDLSPEQLEALMEFVNRMVTPADNSALKAMGIEPTTEKKTVAE